MKKELQCCIHSLKQKLNILIDIQVCTCIYICTCCYMYIDRYLNSMRKRIHLYMTWSIYPSSSRYPSSPGEVGGRRKIRSKNVITISVCDLRRCWNFCAQVKLWQRLMHCYINNLPDWQSTVPGHPSSILTLKSFLQH